MGNVAAKRIDGRWGPGMSGNPSGKAKLTPEQREAAELLRKGTPKAVRKLETLMDHDDPKVSFPAIKLWLERGLPTDVVMRILEEREQRGVEGGLREDLEWLIGEVG
jgi:hypothetical protein